MMREHPSHNGTEDLFDEGYVARPGLGKKGR
jgi:hypothetical protein